MLEFNIAGKKKPKKRASNNLLMHFDGPNGSTNFKDEYGNGVLLTDTPIISTATSKFGGSCGFFKVGSLKLTKQLLLVGDYTVEGWIYLEGLPSGRMSITQQFGTANCSLMVLSNGGLGYWLEGSATGSTLAAAGITTGKWVHIAATRKGGIYRLFSEGIKKFESAILPTPVIKIDSLIRETGASIPGERLNGFFDELHVIDGVAQYINNFTPPAAPFTI